MRAVPISFLIFLLWFVSCGENPGKQTAKNSADTTRDFFPEKFCGDHSCYSLFFKGNLKIELRDHRPTKKDTAVKLCIPAAFTRLEDDSIDGLFIANGKIHNGNKINHNLGGALLISNEKVSIMGTNDGKAITDSLVAQLIEGKNSFFQQIQLVRDSLPLPFHRDQSLFQRRAIVIFQNGKIAMVESDKALTLEEFAHDLMVMKVCDAIYTDMGDWDEGWYRDKKNGEIKILGTSLLRTSRQSNWLVFTN
ncbi:MAG: hypothetical protein HY064_11665 [Bacteroidetes bacterium]|nr:hypothetical protein [Bacteroidota bacterium]